MPSGQRATSREIRDAIRAFHDQRDTWGTVQVLISEQAEAVKKLEQNDLVTRSVLCRSFGGRLRWLLLGR